MFKSAIKFLIKDSAIYGLAGAVNKIIAVLSTPIILRFLSKEEFGIASTVMGGTVFFIGFILLGMDSSIARFFFDRNKNDKEYNLDYKKKVVTIGFSIQTISLILFCLIFFFQSEYVGNFLFDSDKTLVLYWKLFLLSIPGNAFLIFSNNLFKWTFQRSKYLFVSIGNTISTFALTIIFIYPLEMNINGVLLAPIISSIIFSIIGVYFSKEYLRFNNIYDKELINEMLKYGLPFAVVMILGSLMPSLDRLFLLRHVDMKIIGEYSVAVKICGLLYLFTAAFQISFGPYAFSIWHKKFAKKIFSKIMVVYFAFIVSVSVLTIFFSDLIVTIFAGSQYLDVTYLFPILLLAISVKSLSEFSLIGINWSKKSYINLFAILIKFLILFLLINFTVEKYTLVGVAISLLISELIYIFFTFYISNKFYKISINHKKIFLILFLASFFSYIKIYFSDLLLNYILIIPFLFLMFRVVLDKNQIKKILILITKKLNK